MKPPTDKDFFDLAVGNVPFGQYQVSDRAYDKLGFSIHNYFFAKALEQVRPGGVVAFVTSRYTMDAKDSAARKYIAQRAELPRRDPPAQQCVQSQRRYGCCFGHYLSSKAGQTH